MRALLFAAVLLVASQAQAADKDRIVGTWKLVAVMYEDQATKEQTPVLGEHPRGYQIATPEGRWIALVTADGRPVPKTDEDRAKALRSMIAYSGRYRVEDGKVITKVEVAWNEAWSAASRCASCASRVMMCCTSKARRCRTLTSTTRWCGSS
jgi:hypothetical protein